jgi:hypothetical protein
MKLVLWSPQSSLIQRICVGLHLASAALAWVAESASAASVIHPRVHPSAILIPGIHSHLLRIHILLLRVHVLVLILIVPHHLRILVHSELLVLLN